MIILQSHKATVELIEHFIDPSLFYLLREDIAWTQNHIRLFGKRHLEPRLTAWFGPKYSYSSIRWPGTIMPDYLKKIANQITSYCGQPFNAVLLNYYRNGQDSMGWHSDNEPEIIGQTIASISLGASRDFKIRHRESKETTTINLTTGSLLLMTNLQKDFHHALPKRSTVTQPRINLTFRLLRT